MKQRFGRMKEWSRSLTPQAIGCSDLRVANTHNGVFWHEIQNHNCLSCCHVCPLNKILILIFFWQNLSTLPPSWIIFFYLEMLILRCDNSSTSPIYFTFHLVNFIEWCDQGLPNCPLFSPDTQLLSVFTNLFTNTYDFQIDGSWALSLPMCVSDCPLISFLMASINLNWLRSWNFIFSNFLLFISEF